MTTTRSDLPKLRWQPRFVKAYWPWDWILRRGGWAAIPMPWRTVYCRPDVIDDQIMRAHEMVHFEQMERLGTVWFCIKYVWLSLRLGYHRNPLEIEAWTRFGYGGDVPDYEQRQAASRC
jgi:hypothetical protein